MAFTPADSDETIRRLHDKLDTLWTAYLQHLEAYTAAQKLLQNHMSAGFLSLARANFSTSTRRYGKDCFDKRAVASRRAKLSSETGGHPSSLEVFKWTGDGPSPEVDGGEKSEQIKNETQQQPSPPATPAPEDSGRIDDDEESKAKSEGKPAFDPLRQFGILVPPSLRQSHISFTTAVDEAIADAANSAIALREVESGIRRLRKEIKKAEKL